ncbi:hypothetical protein Leryth_007753 [Lithospermum erythrorhizon]|nr:hypothetical protein Leryth_007753 [Lithospermum erythrorhizon]
MNDLLSDNFDAKNNSSQENDIEMGRLQRSSSDMGLEALNKQTPEVDKQIEKLSLIVLNVDKTQAIRRRMEKDIDEVGKIARSVKSKLEAISKDNLANRQKPGCGKGTAVDRSRTNMTNALTKKFKEVMSEFQTLRQNIDDEYREVVERRVMTGQDVGRFIWDLAVLVEAQGDMLDNIGTQSVKIC